MIKRSKKGQSIYFEIRVWKDEKDEIHVVGPYGASLHTKVSPKESSVRYHASLYKALDRLLKEEGRA